MKDVGKKEVTKCLDVAAIVALSKKNKKNKKKKTTIKKKEKRPKKRKQKQREVEKEPLWYLIRRRGLGSSLQYPLFLFIYALVVVLVLLLVCCYLVMCLVLFMLSIEDTAPFKFGGVLTLVHVMLQLCCMFAFVLHVVFAVLVMLGCMYYLVFA